MNFKTIVLPALTIALPVLVWAVPAVAQQPGSTRVTGADYHVRLTVQPLTVIDFTVDVRAAKPGAQGHAFLRFFDAQGKPILTFRGWVVKDTTWQHTGYYTEAPVLARTMEAGVSGSVYFRHFHVDPADGKSPTRPAPRCNLDEYMEPFWKSDTIYNETVLLFKSGSQPPRGSLLFKPDEILSVRSFDGQTTYREGSDYTITGRTIDATPNSPMPFKVDTSFDQQKDFAWFNLQNSWVTVTYTHKDRWDGPKPVYEGDRLPHTVAKLRAGLPLRIVAYGMSITRGLDVSGYDSVPPFMPSYIDLLARSLKKVDRNVRVWNAGLPGSTVDWGAQYADDYVSPLHPDLVILDFGMNDFWRMTPPEFKHYIDTIEAKIRAKAPRVEFLLLANMQFDPAYLKNSDGKADWYRNNLLGYSTVLTNMEGKGVACLDMTSISGAIYVRKKPKDCVANPLHPNDYLARWYAQGLTTLLTDVDPEHRDDRPTLGIGEPAPDFRLPGVDGKTYTLGSFSKADVLVVIFMCNHCPTSQAYEGRIIQLTKDYAGKGVQVVAINPNHPESLRLDELGYSDLGDSFEEMKVRARDAHYNFPYLYDGDKELAAKAYGPVATPHVFIFDRERTLRYEGRVDDTEDPRKTAHSQDARAAIDALLAGKEVPVAITKTFGCSIKWIEKGVWKKRAEVRWAEEPVAMDTIGLEGIRELLRNQGGRLTLINCWATWCVPCVREFPDLVTLNRVYRDRGFRLVTISTDDSAHAGAALAFLKREQSSSPNYRFAGEDHYAFISAIDSAWKGALPYSLLIEPGGKVVYAHEGVIDYEKVRKLIFDDPGTGRIYAPGK